MMCAYGSFTGNYNVPMSFEKTTQNLALPVSHYLKPHEIDRLLISFSSEDYGRAEYSIEMSLGTVNGDEWDVETMMFEVEGSCGSCDIKKQIHLDDTFSK